MPLAKVLSNHEGYSEEESGAVREVLRVHMDNSHNSNKRSCCMEVFFEVLLAPQCMEVLL